MRECMLSESTGEGLALFEIAPSVATGGCIATERRQAGRQGCKCEKVPICDQGERFLFRTAHRLVLHQLT